MPRHTARSSVLALGLVAGALAAGAVVAPPPAAAVYQFAGKWGEPGTGQGQFRTIGGLDVHPATGRVYVVDTFNHRIQRFTARGRFIDAWGGLGDAEGRFRRPDDVAVDPAGQAYVSDSRGNRVQKFHATGAFLRMWGVGVDTGSPFFEICTAGCRRGGDGVWADSFNSPGAMGLGSGAEVYVADDGNSRIQRYSPAGVHLGGFTAAGEGHAAFFGGIRGLDAHAGSGDIYTSDAYFDEADDLVNRVQRYEPAGSLLGQWGGTGTANGRFGRVDRLTVNDSTGEIFVSDRLGHRVQRFGPTGAFRGKWGSRGRTNGRFIGPSGIAVSPTSGDVYVADATARIQRFVDAPQTRIVGGPSGRTQQRTARFRFRSDEPGSSFRCRLDRRAWRLCSSPQRYRGLRPGRHVFRVRASRAGREDPSPAVRRWTVTR